MALVNGVVITWMIRRDLPRVLEIEKESFQFPWSEEDFCMCLRERTCIGVVARDSSGSDILGFMIYELHKQRIHLLNLAVASDQRRCGVGEAMITRLLGKLTPDRRNRITAEVRESNLPAHLFFRACDFRATRVLRDYYAETGEDAYVFEHRWSKENYENSLSTN